MSDYEENSLYTKAYNPILLAGVIFGAHILVVMGSILVRLSGLVEVGQRFPWLSAASFLLFFAVFNSIFSLSSKNAGQYWSRSIASFAGLAIANGLAAWLFSALTINQAGSFRWIYVVVTFGYLVFMSIMNMIKRIVEFAQREEWNQPRIRNWKKRS
ncbi:MAG: hypothetical protein IPL49_14250 [Saprospirales bacterium]|nr:hypothetical protein [Saprospirales bacterium]